MARPQANIFRTVTANYPSDLGTEQSAEQHYMIFDAYDANMFEGVDADPNPRASVALYIPPGALRTNYSSKYETMEGFDGVVNAARRSAAAIAEAASLSDSIDVGSILGSAVKNAESSLLNVGAATGSNALRAAAARSDIAKAAFAGAGIAKNPYLTVFFSGPGDFRKFQFSYTFVAKNSSEANQVEKIVDIFRESSLPTKITAQGGTKSYFLGAPRKFRIHFYIKKRTEGSINGPTTTMFRIGPSVLTDITVDYGGSGIPVFFEDGKPFNVKLDLSFQELTLITRNNVTDKSTVPV